MVLGGKMEQIRVYFLEIIDLNNQKHQIKSDDYNKIWDFVKRHKGKIRGLHSGSKTVSEAKFKEIQKDENFRQAGRRNDNFRKTEEETGRVQQDNSKEKGSMRKEIWNDNSRIANLLAGEKG